MSGGAARYKMIGGKAKVKVYKTANGTKVMMRTKCSASGVCTVEKMYNKKTKSGVVRVTQSTTYKSSAKKYRK
jgi:hypothetical protein